MQSEHKSAADSMTTRVGGSPELDHLYPPGAASINQGHGGDKGNKFKPPPLAHSTSFFQQSATTSLTAAQANTLTKQLAQTLKRQKENESTKKLGPTEVYMKEHLLNDEEVAAMHETSIDTGLSMMEAERRLRVNGPNSLTPQASKSKLRIFLEEFTAFFAMLLETAAILCFVAYGLDQHEVENLYLGVALIIVVLVSALFSYYQNAKSADILSSFKNILPAMCLVMRNGSAMEVPVSHVVVGDVILMKEGNRVAADVRVIESTDFKVDNSSLTGESEPQRRSNQNKNTNPLEATNIAYYGTLAVSGHCKGIVINTGDRTAIGKIANLAATTSNTKAPLVIEIEQFIHMITVLAMTLGVIFLIIALLSDYTAIEAIVFAIGIIVGNVPEGLLVSVTVCLTITAQRMAKKHVLVKSLASVETLGSTTVIASDKTGTLTQNRMTVAHMMVDNRMLDVLGDNNLSRFKIDSMTKLRLFEIACLCNNAVFEPSQEDKPIQDRLTHGDATESAFIKFCETLLVKAHKKQQNIITPLVQQRSLKNVLEDKHTALPSSVNSSANSSPRQSISGSSVPPTPKVSFRISSEKEKKDALLAAVAGSASVANSNVALSMSVNRCRIHFPKVNGGEIPFNSANKYQVSIHVQNNDWSLPRLCLMKGAPERIVDRCDFVASGNKTEPMTKAHRANIQKHMQEMMRMGERVLGLCYAELPTDEYPKNYKFDANSIPPNFPTQKGDGLVFAGLVSLIDPPREDVPQAVKLCISAGIKVIMVTGDHPETAEAIARKVGIIRGRTRRDVAREENCALEDIHPDDARVTAIVVTGSELSQLEDTAFQRVLDYEQIVFARTSPQQKLIIVQGLQNKRWIRRHYPTGSPKPVKHVVAVTGDGVNDAPALKAADIGIAMGRTGSDVARDAAKMILLNDNFASIVDGIEEGRVIFDNLKKSIAFALSTNVAKVMPFLSAIIVGIPLPLTTLLIVFIDIGTDLLPGISYAYEEKEADIMSRKPRNSATEHLVNAKLMSYAYFQIGVVQCIAAFFSYFVVLYDYGFHPTDLPGSSDAFKNGYVLAAGATDASTGYVNTGGSSCLFYNGECQAYLGDCTFSAACHAPQEALYHAQTAYFLSLVAVQWADLIICKTRLLSIRKQGMGNQMLNFGIAYMVFATVFLCYIPAISDGINTRPIRIEHWFAGLPWAMFMVVYDEVRKWLMRNLPKDNWFLKNTNY